MELAVENHVLDEHALDLDTPSLGYILDNFGDACGDFLAAFDDILQNTSTDDVAEGSLCALNESLADIADAEGSLVRRDNMVVNDRRKMQRNVVLGHAHLLGHLHNLNLDIDLNKVFREGVNLDESGVHRLVETSEFGDEADIALGDGLVGVWTADAAGNGAEEADYAADAVNHPGIPALREGIFGGGEGASVGGLEVFDAGGLNLEGWLAGAAIEERECKH